jgi:hypothetical protein
MPSQTLIGDSDGDGFYGGRMAGAGDVDGDGCADLLVGAWALDAWKGSAFLYLGDPLSLPSSAAAVMSGATQSCQFANSLF